MVMHVLMDTISQISILYVKFAQKIVSSVKLIRGINLNAWLVM